MIKKVVLFFAMTVISLTLTFTISGVRIVPHHDFRLTQIELSTALIKQDIEYRLTDPMSVYKVYYKDRLVGIMEDTSGINELLDSTYTMIYAEDFPEAQLLLNEDIMIIEDVVQYKLKNIDNEVVSFIEANQLYSIEVTRIDFSSGYTIYVNRIEDFEAAREQYLLNFISKDAYDAIIRKEEIPPLDGYGYREMNLIVSETIQVSKGRAKAEEILKDKNEIVYFFSYGFDTEIKTYTVQPFDTVEAVAYFNGLTPQQVLSINADKVKSYNQILEAGMKLNVTYFNSPIKVVVIRERLAEEIVYPQSTLFLPDPDIREGMTRIATREKTGTKDVLYLETYVNGVLMGGQELKSSVTKEPTREVIMYGTRVIPGIGSGTFRMPVDNYRISCGWMCYTNHQAIDLVDRYARYGYIYASDRGVVQSRGYDPLRSGYWIRINHNNGYTTFYAHLDAMAYFPPGVAVEKGERIGRIGMTGRTTGPHVHFTITHNGKNINPCSRVRC
ncbi:MAG: peptidoglycan DD-metalloendopeptidase family protein [Erysipelothrix sp.]|jgi:murein DD-endopeptidase MepM/ murein hydrolase activator NlpD|nr:peptidoglycan DD-metalloendopeptidase family protein [Erysipelothrix sp.]